jgi:hypothetical protein
MKEHDTKFKTCAACRETGRKSWKKRKREPKHCEENQRECTHYFNVKHVDEFERKRSGQTTKWCINCRDSLHRSQNNLATAYGKCKAVYETWKHENPCEVCGISNPDVIEADHLHPNSKENDCGNFSYWARYGGPEALKRELLTTGAKCRFCHVLKTDSERGAWTCVSRLEKREIINDEKLKRACCLDCRRLVTGGAYCAFNFGLRRGETSNITVSNLVYKSRAYFNEHIGIEMKKRDLLCANCFKIWKDY